MKNGLSIMNKRKIKSKAKAGGKLTPEIAKDAARAAIRMLFDTSLTISAVEDDLEKEGLKHPGLKIARQQIDDLLGVALLETTIAHHLAMTTESFELFSFALCGSLRGADHLPKLLARFEEKFAEPYDFESDHSDTVYFHFAQLVLTLTEFLEKISEEHPERFHLIAREMPCWPFRLFRHRKAYAKRFDRLADRLELGKLCPIHSSSSAEYSFEKRINAFVFEILSEFLRVHSYLSTREDETEEKCLESAGIPTALHHHFLKSYQLPRLTKGATAKDWAETVIIPYLEGKYADWSSVPALKEFLGKAGGRAKAKEAVKGALESMAWPDEPI
jgi:hypothetical protein